jgi:hypothetical protein
MAREPRTAARSAQSVGRRTGEWYGGAARRPAMDNSGPLKRPRLPGDSGPPCDAYLEEVDASGGRYEGTEFENWTRCTDNAPELWTSEWEIEAFLAARACAYPNGAEDRGLRVVVGPDPIRTAWQTLDAILAKHSELPRIAWRVEPLGTGDIQIRNGRNEVLAVFEIKTISDYLSSLGSTVTLKAPKVQVTTGRGHGQRERIGFMHREGGVRGWWIIKNVRRSVDLPRDLLSSVTKMEVLEPGQSARWAANNADVVRQVLHVLATFMKGPELKSKKAELIDQPPAYFIRLEPSRWTFQVAPGIGADACGGLQEKFPVPRAFHEHFAAAPPKTWDRLLENVPTKSSTEEAAAGKPSPRLGPARAKILAHFNGYIYIPPAGE